MAPSAGGLDNIQRSIAGIVRLVDVTGLDGDPDVLARFAVPAADQYAAAIMAGEAKHGDFTGTAYGVTNRWLGNTSRDQYPGVFFGLALAYDLVPGVRPQVQPLVGRLLDFLLRTGWNIVMPNGTISTTFTGRPDQQLRSVRSPVTSILRNTASGTRTSARDIPGRSARRSRTSVSTPMAATRSSTSTTSICTT